MDMLVDQNTGNLYVANVIGQIYKVIPAQTLRVIINDPKVNIYKLYIHPQTRLEIVNFKISITSFQ